MVFSLFLWLCIEQRWIRGHGVVVHDWYSGTILERTLSLILN